MHTITLEVDNSAYDSIMSFIKRLPKNAARVKEYTSKSPQSSLLKIKKIQGLGKELYRNIEGDAYIQALRDEW